MNSQLMHHIDSWLTRQSRSRIITISLASFLLISAFDMLTGPDLAVSLFYLLSIAIAAWYGDRTLAVIFALLSAAAWFTAIKFSGKTYSYAAIIYWNALVRLGIFYVFVTLLSKLRIKLRQEQETAGTDYLTGTVNSRALYEQLEKECRG